MRKAIYRGTDGEALAVFARAPVLHLATTNDAGEPVLRALHAVVDDIEGGLSIAFHGAPAGEKMEGLGRKAVFSAEETVASIPSYFLDPERACPATTYYLSAQAHGVIEQVTGREEKARVLSALMAKHQSEGGYRPLHADDPLYRKAIAGLLVGRLRIERVACKAKLGQNRRLEERSAVLAQLWARGRPEDVRAIALILGRFPDLPRPTFLRGPSGIALSCAASDADLGDAAALLADAYWLEGISRDAVREAFVRSSAVVLARDEAGDLVGVGRAVSDGRVAWIYDVMVAERARGRGVGTALVRILLDHPAVRGVRRVRLGTRNAMDFYQRLGFRAVEEAPTRPYPVTEMILSEREPERGAGVPRTDAREDARL